MIGLSYCYNYTGAIKGFINLGDINSHLTAFEESLKHSETDLEQLANSMLVIMVKGLFSRVQFRIHMSSFLVQQSVVTSFSSLFGKLYAA